MVNLLAGSTLMRPGAFIIAIAGCVMLGLAACDDGPKPLEKGTYKGEVDTTLSDEQRKALRQRGLRQRQ